MFCCVVLERYLQLQRAALCAALLCIEVLSWVHKSSKWLQLRSAAGSEMVVRLCWLLEGGPGAAVLAGILLCDVALEPCKPLCDVV